MNRDVVNQGSLNYQFLFGDQTQTIRTDGNFEEFPYESALLGLVSYNDPSKFRRILPPRAPANPVDAHYWVMGRRPKSLISGKSRLVKYHGLARYC